MATKLIYIAQTAANAKSSTSGVSLLGTNWNNAANQYYRSLVFTSDGHLLTHGLDINGLTYKLTLNGSVQGTNTSDAVDLGSFYAPTSAGSLYLILLANASGVPTWLALSTSIEASYNSEGYNVPTAKAVRDAITSGFAANDAMIFKGTYTPRTTNSTVDTTKFSTAPSTTSLGWTWIVSGVTNTNKYFADIEVENGDMIIANVENPGTTKGNYTIVQTNLVGAMLKTDYPDLLSIEALTGTSGFLKKTAANTWALANPVTSVTITQGTGITVSDSGTAITTTGTRTISLNKATTTTIGGIIVSNILTSALTLTSVNGSTANRFYGVLLDKDGKAFVNIPWENTWRAINAYALTAGTTNGTTGASISSQSFGSGSLNFGSGLLNVSGTIDIGWCDIDSSGNKTFTH